MKLRSTKFLLSTGMILSGPASAHPLPSEAGAFAAYGIAALAAAVVVVVIWLLSRRN